MHGENLETEEDFTSPYITIKNQNDFLGMGQNSKDLIKNYS